MMGVLSGFSSWLLNTDNFNPFSGIPFPIFSCHNIKLPMRWEYTGTLKFYSKKRSPAIHGYAKDLFSRRRDNHMHALSTSRPRTNSNSGTATGK